MYLTASSPSKVLVKSSQSLLNNFNFNCLCFKNDCYLQMASGNKRIEEWARDNLRDSQYLFSRPSLLRLYYNAKLAIMLNDMLDNGALLGLGLKILRPLFKDKYKRDKYAEIVENDMKLWEVNA